MVNKTYLYTFPLPPIELKTNRRRGQHWGALHQIKKGYEMECLAAWSVMPEEDRRPDPHIMHCYMIVTAYLGTGQSCDPSDLGSWAKSAVDFMVKKKVIASDSSACVSEFTTYVSRDRKWPRLEISVEALP